MDPRSSTGEAHARTLVWAGLAAVLGGAMLVGGWHLLHGRAPGSPPVFGHAPSFTLTERSGRTVTAHDLLGRPWIADFIFTRCQGICPVLSDRMASLLRRLERAGVVDATAVSFSVDPEHDDPATLRAYADRFEADPERWLFLTGPMAEIERVVRDGFRLSIATLPEAERRTAPEPITHSDRFVLVDAQLRIRGYYHGTEDDAVAALERDLLALR